MRIRRSDPDGAGFRRVRRGRGFGYLDTSGAVVGDAEQLERFKKLAIPPAWREVWICPWPNGHIQAIGTDDAGRRQYLYHERFRAQQEEAKHEHVLDVAERLPAARATAREDLARRGLGRERVLACAVCLLDLGLFRIGSERYTEANGSFGLTTLQCGHVQSGRGARLEFDFRGKGGKPFAVVVRDDEVARAVRALRRGRGGTDRLLAYRAGNMRHDVRGEELNGYLREIFGMEVSAKDFRTWHATVLAAVALAERAPDRDRSARARRSAEVAAVREVAAELGNTPAVCRASYINHRVFELYGQGRVLSAGSEPERAVLELLRS